MDEQSRLVAPVTAFLSALDLRNRDVVSSTLADDVRLNAPSLGFTCCGRDLVLDVLGAILVAFPDVRYRVRNRYVAPEQVTDEAVLEGTRTGPLMGIAPNGAAGTVPARVMMTHDGVVLTEVTLWADGGALRELVDLPETLPATSSPLVRRLRATLPAAQSRVILARERDATVPEREPQTLLPQMAPQSRPRTTPTGSALKVPVPRKIRRLQAVVLAFLMVGASSALVAWVVSGTVRKSAEQPRPQAAASITPTVAASLQAGGMTLSDPDGSVPLRFNASRNEFQFSSDSLFFATNSTDLTPQARTALDKVVARIRAEHRYGQITVTGYTDQRGSKKHNLVLSKDRADAVAAALRTALGSLAERVSVVATGRGETDLIVTKGTTSEQLAPNRRVNIQVPKATP